MPVISKFFGVVIRMYYDEHNPPHFHAEYQNNNAIFDMQGNITKGDLKSRTATKLVRDWVDLHQADIEKNWDLAVNNQQILKIKPLD
jgi:hypothetical protein